MKIAAWLLVALCSTVAFAAAAPNACKQFASSLKKGNPDAKLRSFLDTEWKYEMHEYPEWATNVGFVGQDDRWTDNSLAALERRRVETRCLLATLKKIPRKSLSQVNQVNYDLTERDLGMTIEGEPFGGDYLPVNHMSGTQTDIVDTLSAMPANSAADFENILKRLDRVATLFQQVQVLMQEGLKRKLTPTKLFLPKVLAQVEALMPVKVNESPLYKPFTDMGSTLTATEQDALRARAKEVLREKVYPALSSFKDFLSKDYIPKARETIAWSDLPNGQAYYAYLVKYHTTTRATPEELHQTGLQEVERLTAIMVAIKDQVQFKGDMKAFNHFLLTDPRFYYTSAEDLLTGFRDITKRIDPELPKMFKTLPRLTYGVREVPAFRAASSAAAEYQSGSLEAGRAGWFQANTSDLKSRAKWEMETLAFHEGVPGHHLQISIAQELEGLPEFRKFGGYTAFAEGWALYAESLGEEMGFYKDPYSRYGHYSDELLRAVRLVVDTGMHAKGWSREKALDYYRSHLPTSDSDADIEINRYIVWPGQALAYKVGQLKFRALRDHATKELGADFNIREFHDVVLGQGALPMEVLEKVVETWIAAKKKPMPHAKAKVTK